MKANVVSVLYVTFPTERMAFDVARLCIENKLIACANVLGSVKSIYEWKGKLCDELEWAVLMKCRSSQVKAAIKKIKSLHDHQCPCIIELPVTGGSADFLKWILNPQA